MVKYLFKKIVFELLEKWERDVGDFDLLSSDEELDCAEVDFIQTHLPGWVSFLTKDKSLFIDSSQSFHYFFHCEVGEDASRWPHS